MRHLTLDAPTLPAPATDPDRSVRPEGSARIVRPGSALGLYRKRAGPKPRPAPTVWTGPPWGREPGCPAHESRDLGVPCSRIKLSPGTSEQTLRVAEPPPRAPAFPGPTPRAATDRVAGSDLMQRAVLRETARDRAGTQAYRRGPRLRGLPGVRFVLGWPVIAAAGETPVLPVGRELPVSRAVPSSHSRSCCEYNHPTPLPPDPPFSVFQRVRPVLGIDRGVLPKTGANGPAMTGFAPLGLTGGVSAGCYGGS